MLTGVPVKRREFLSTAQPPQLQQHMLRAPQERMCNSSNILGHKKDMASMPHEQDNGSSFAGIGPSILCGKS